MSADEMRLIEENEADPENLARDTQPLNSMRRRAVLLGLPAAALVALLIAWMVHRAPGGRGRAHSPPARGVPAASLPSFEALRASDGDAGTEPSGSLRLGGHVVDADERPVEGAHVW